MMTITTVPGLSVSSSLDANWERLNQITSAVIGTSDISQHSFAAQAEERAYIALLSSLRHDHYVGDVCLLGMKRAPASCNRHHDVEGGLVRHLLQMWELWIDFRSVLRSHNAYHPLLDDTNIWKCILHHDLNKVWKYQLVPKEDGVWAVDNAKNLDAYGSFLGDTNKSLFFLNRAGIILTPVLHNALMFAEGSYSTQPRTTAESVLCKVAYLLDDMSANVIDRLQNNRFWDSKAGGISEVP